MREYLEALAACPDESLRDRLGVYDNWPIYLKADFETVIDGLMGTGKFVLGDKTDVECELNYAPKPVRVRVFNSLERLWFLKPDNIVRERVTI